MSSSERTLSARWTRDDAIRDSDLDKNEKAVLNAYLDTDRQAAGLELYYSLERIAWITRLANSTVRDTVKKLETRGVLE